MKAKHFKFIYVFWNETRDWYYIGKTDNLARRYLEHTGHKAWFINELKLGKTMLNKTQGEGADSKWLSDLKDFNFKQYKPMSCHDLEATEDYLINGGPIPYGGSQVLAHINNANYYEHMRFKSPHKGLTIRKDDNL